MSLQRERPLMLALLILAAASWGILIWQSSTVNGIGMGMGMSMGTGTGLTAGMGAALFLAIWIVMMLAMMLPSAAPVILAFAQVRQSQRSEKRAAIPIWVFIGAYLLVWTLFGALAFLGALAATALAQQAPWLMQNTTRISGGIIGLAGLYQLTPLKRVCLAKCRAPLDFTPSSWHDGYSGALRMGLRYGLYCLGSYWLLFVLLFPLGIMNLAAMALLAALIFAEKVVPQGQRIRQIVALALILYGVFVIVHPLP